jgi:hypothetical protein
MNEDTEDNERIQRNRVMMVEHTLLNFIAEDHHSTSPCTTRHQRDHSKIFVECSLPISLLFPERGVGVGCMDLWNDRYSPISNFFEKPNIQS